MWTGFPSTTRSVDIPGATGSADHGSWGARADSRPDRTLQCFGSTTRGGSNQWPAIPARGRLHVRGQMLATHSAGPRKRPSDKPGHSRRRHGNTQLVSAEIPTAWLRPTSLVGPICRADLESLTKEQVPSFLQIPLCDPALSPGVACRPLSEKGAASTSAIMGTPEVQVHDDATNEICYRRALMTRQLMAADPTPARNFLLGRSPRRGCRCR